MTTAIVRKAKAHDADRILTLVNDLAAQQIMLPRSPVAIVENIRDFVVAEVEGEFAGCGALHVVWSDLAEVRSIAVEPKAQGKGIGKRMLEWLIKDALELELARIFAFTYVPGFFEKMDFAIVEHGDLPHKVFSDCLNCPKFNRCDEIAMLRVLKESNEEHGQGPLSTPSSGFPLPRIQL